MTKPVTATVEKVGSGKDPRAGKTLVGFEGKFTLKRSDFDIKYMVGPVSDEIDVHIALQAVGSLTRRSADQRRAVVLRLLIVSVLVPGLVGRRRRRGGAAAAGFVATAPRRAARPPSARAMWRPISPPSARRRFRRSTPRRGSSISRCIAAALGLAAAGRAPAGAVGRRAVAAVVRCSASRFIRWCATSGASRVAGRDRGSRLGAARSVVGVCGAGRAAVRPPSASRLDRGLRLGGLAPPVRADRSARAARLDRRRRPAGGRRWRRRRRSEPRPGRGGAAFPRADAPRAGAQRSLLCRAGSVRRDRARARPTRRGAAALASRGAARAAAWSRRRWASSSCWRRSWRAARSPTWPTTAATPSHE